jgi:hypothetical protein
MAVQTRAEQAVTAMAQKIGVTPVAQVTVATLPPVKLKVKAAPPVFPQVDLSSADPAPVPAAPAQPPPQQPIAATAIVAEPAPVLKEAVTVLNPRGDGDPDTITCRAPQALPSSRLPGPQVCKTNRAWAQLRADGKDISEDGTVVLSRTRQTIAAGCSKSALLGSFQSQNLPDGSVLSGCR